MTDEEILKAFHLCNTDTDCDNSDCPYKDMISGCIPALNNDITSRFTELKAENAALRNQISEMVMPPCTLGETLYIVACTFGDGYVEDEIVHQSGFSVVKSIVTEKNFYRMCDLVRNGEAFFSQEAAERELEELVGK